MNFASDNAGPAHPAALEALAIANNGYAASYGADPITGRVVARIRDIFEAPEAAVHLVATGTAANALALATLAPPWSTIWCQRESHAEVDECGAPEFYTGGAKLTLLDGEHGRVAPDSLAAALKRAEAAAVHQVQKGALTLTNATEAGTVYDPPALARLSGIARAAGVPVHLDGARFANAAAALGASPADLSWRAGVDALSFGGTKNGLLGAEAVVLFDPAKSWELQLRRKRGGHLFSKHRFLAAQMEAYLADGLWLDLAGRANAAAARLAAGLRRFDDVEILHPVEANMVFAALPAARHRDAVAAGATYARWDWGKDGADPAGAEEPVVIVRLVCNWATSETEIAAFLAALDVA